MNGAGPWSLQRFETDILGFPVWRLSDPLVAMAAVEAAAADGRVLIACRIAQDDAAGAAALSAAGFLQVDTLVTLARALHPEDAGPLPQGVFVAAAQDAPGCGMVGAVAFRKDRFHADTRIEPAGADAVKRHWAENAVLGRADRVFITRGPDGDVSGFNACLAPPDKAVIDLIGVRPEATGQGLGSRLVEAAIAHYAASRIRLEVGTQAANEGSLRFYRRLGFNEIRRQISWHWMG